MLGDLHENLIGVTTPAGAFEQLLKQDIAVVLMDVQMPEIDGFELAAMIREHPRFEKIAIIFVSAMHQTELDRLRGYAAGAVDYVPVPVVPEVLRAKVRVFAELYRKTRQLERLNVDLELRVAERTSELEASTRRLEQSEQRLERLNEELESRIEERTREREAALAQLFEAQKIDTIGQLTGGVAHDFNNLLMAILGSLELLRKRVVDERSTRLLNNAVKGAERGAALTKRLLAFARRQELKPQAIGLAELVEGIRDLLDRAIGPSIEIHSDLDATLPAVRADANQLELALLNLVVNARDAMPNGGAIRLVAKSLEVRAGEVDLAPGDYVQLAISDGGIGMDQVTLAKAAQPFFTTKGPGKGTGLGLSMVHGMVAQSGGVLRIESEPGAGTTVRLILPIALPEGAAKAVAKKPEPATRGADRELCILLVDDDGLVRTGAAAMLEDLGHRVIEAGSGQAALEILERRPDVELVVTDHAMPGLTGAELVQQVSMRFPHVQTMLASGFAELSLADGRVSALHLTKPFTQAELQAAIVRAMDEPGRGDDSGDSSLRDARRAHGSPQAART